MAKKGRKKKIWINDFAEQQKALLAKHWRGEELTQEEVTYLVGKDGKMPKSRDEMVTKMTICKWEKSALEKMRKAICKSYPKWSESQVKEAMLEMLNRRSSAKQTNMPERLDYSYST